MIQKTQGMDVAAKEVLALISQCAPWESTITGGPTLPDPRALMCMKLQIFC